MLFRDYSGNSGTISVCLGIILGYLETIPDILGMVLGYSGTIQVVKVQLLGHLLALEASYGLC